MERKRRGEEQGKENSTEAEELLNGTHCSRDEFQTAQSGVSGQKARVKRLLGGRFPHKNE